MDCLVEIGPFELKVLRDRYRGYLKEKQYGYNTLQTYLRWMDNDQSIEHLNIYCLNGVLDNGTFVLIHYNMIYGDTLSEDFDNLVSALCLLNLSPIKQYRYNFGHEILPAVLKFVQQKGLKIGSAWRFPTHYVSPGNAKWISLPNLQDGFLAKTLDENDAFEINKNWRYSYPMAELRIACLINNNPNIGIYTKTGQLAGWALRYELGGLAILHVHETFRKRGLGSYMIKAMAKKTGDMGENLCFVNQLVCNLLKPIGYERVNDMIFLNILPTE